MFVLCEDRSHDLWLQQRATEVNRSSLINNFNFYNTFHIQTEKAGAQLNTLLVHSLIVTVKCSYLYIKKWFFIISGSGIFSGNAGALISITPGIPSSHLLVTRVPKKPGHVSVPFSYPILFLLTTSVLIYAVFRLRNLVKH